MFACVSAKKEHSHTAYQHYCSLSLSLSLSHFSLSHISHFLILSLSLSFFLSLSLSFSLSLSLSLSLFLSLSLSLSLSLIFSLDISIHSPVNQVIHVFYSHMKSFLSLFSRLFLSLLTQLFISQSDCLCAMASLIPFVRSLKYSILSFPRSVCIPAYCACVQLRQASPGRFFRLSSFASCCRTLIRSVHHFFPDSHS
ncbi:unnamed protein product [Acanthosepion pharaonis]|uniref:Uncharacterized protein n=1 Tax=Acanthosepion pharaonis TaxID=158019 RepID=A0A812DWS5_ACAPH|nr:unnamed protein product [Sepia pharaonis]